MIISNSNISMQQQHQKHSISTERESLKMWTGNRPDSLPPQANGLAIGRPDNVQLSQQAVLGPHKETAPLDENELSPKDQLKVQILTKMLEALTGKKFEIFDPNELKKELEEIYQTQPDIQPPPSQTQPNFGIEYDYYASHYEYESLSFATEGVIQTKDGQTIQFSAQLNIERELYQEQSFSFRAGNAVKIDPLVLNFNGSAAELDQRKFEFDLDADGQTEQVSLLKPGNAYLALDKNNDGTVNNGSELFGPNTGNGFSELAKYDEDGNNFIDEADSVYDKLRLWTRDANGNEQLVGLGQKGVGAIYLGHLNTPFEIKDNQQQSLGDIVSSSIYLNENGTTGFIQQLDLRV
jgi:hypothetical protein